MKKHVYVIAEAGVNHNGDIEIAKELVKVAAEAGADAVKFQTFKAERLVCRNAQKAAYQLETTDVAESQFEMLKKLELTPQMHEELIAYCKEIGIQFLSTPFDEESVDVLEKMGQQVYKIPSGEITNYPYLRKLGKLKKEIILSTGMSTLEEIETAVQVLKKNGAPKVSILHCNTQYPTPYADVNLMVVPYLKEQLQLTVGYSDHTKGIEVPIAAVALGADIIEKHFTLDRAMEGPDHKASLEPQELKAMVAAIRNIEEALGVQDKKVSPSEEDNLKIVRKSIVASKDIGKGEVFTEENLTTKRPGTGINPMKWEEVIGCCAGRDFKEDELIEI